MKKKFILLLILGLLFLVGCQTENKEKQLKVDANTEEISIYKNENYELYIINKTNTEEFTNFVNNLEKIKYLELDKKESDEQIIFDYIINLPNMTIKLNSEYLYINTFKGTNELTVNYSVNKITAGSIAFLNEIQFKEIKEEPTYNEYTIGYTEDDLKDILFTIIDTEVTYDLSKNTYLKQLLLTTKYYSWEDNNQNSNYTSKYELQCGEYTLTINTDKTITYNDNNLFVLNNELDYLDNLFVGEVLDFNKYTENQTIEVKNSKNETGEITDKKVFLEQLQNVKYIKVSNKDHYEELTINFTIKIDEEIISVGNQYISINEELYIVLENDFDFLQNIKYTSSSGWLPWI